jgi:hypothetical protein
MEVVRQEVTALMLDGIQKTASFCASQCAKHVVAARREMHQRLMEQRSEFERGHGSRLQGLSPKGSGLLTPLTPTFHKSGVPPLPGMLSRSSLTPRSAAGEGTPNVPTFGFSPRIAPNLTPRSTQITGVEDVACSAHDTYIDVHDAVQTLEATTNMARSAMDAIEEAINLSVEAVHSKPSTPSGFSPWQAGRMEPNSGVRTPGESTISASAIPGTSTPATSVTTTPSMSLEHPSTKAKVDANGAKKSFIIRRKGSGSKSDHSDITIKRMFHHAAKT